MSIRVAGLAEQKRYDLWQKTNFTYLCWISFLIDYTSTVFIVKSIRQESIEESLDLKYIFD